MQTEMEPEEFADWTDIGEYFDDELYLERNPDVRSVGMEPRLHYLRFGWKEGRQPNAWFDNGYYLSAYPDVASAGINPLVHYARFGREEGRATSGPRATAEARPLRPHDAVRKVIEAAIPAREAAVHYGRPAPQPPLDLGDFLKRIGRGPSEGVVLSFSHDDYAKHFGGVQRLIGDEAEQFNANAWRYLHLSPVQPLPILSEDTELSSFQFVLRLDGEHLGVVSADALLSSLAGLRHGGVVFSLIVHHFMGHAPEIIHQFCEDLEIEYPYVWIHDFYTLCESYNLLRNNWKFCGAPPVESIGCRICAYGEGRVLHIDRMLKFFTALQPVVLAPSESALNVWQRRQLVHREAHVVQIARIVVSEEEIIPKDVKGVRVAFAGQSVHAKGWTVFRKLAAHFHGREGVEFFHFGTRAGGDAGDPGIQHVPVQAGQADRDAMTRAFAEHAIDLVVIWAPWPESFCYVAHEALAAGAGIITNRQAGNVPSVVWAYAPKGGVVLDTEAELFDLFGSQERLEELRSHAPRPGVMLPYRSSAHVILRRHIEGRDLNQFRVRPLAAMETAGG